MWPFRFKVQLRKQTNEEQGLEYAIETTMRAVEGMGVVKMVDRLSTRASLRTGRSKVDLKNERTRRTHRGECSSR